MNSRHNITGCSVCLCSWDHACGSELIRLLGALLHDSVGSGKGEAADGAGAVERLGEHGTCLDDQVGWSACECPLLVDLDEEGGGLPDTVGVSDVAEGYLDACCHLQWIGLK